MDDSKLNTFRKDINPNEKEYVTDIVHVVRTSLRTLPSTWDGLQKLVKDHDSELKKAANSKGMLDVSKCDPVAQGIAKYSLSAIDIGRPLGSVIIMLYGETKAGKSCTINRLLKKPLCQEGDELDPSKTKDCVEFTTSLVNFKEHVRFNLNLVDVPGTCDSEGTRDDALNAGTLRKFLVTHSLLGHNGGRPTFALPNVVMVTFNAVGVKFPEKSTSNFYKTLQALKETGVVDKERLNLVIVGTHAMQIQKGKWKERIDKLRTVMAETAKSILELDQAWEIPVVFVENDPDKDSDYKYDASNEFVMLPDGSRSHYNLFLALFKLFTINGDNLGLLALGTAWKVQDGEDKQKLNPKKGHHVQSSPENLNSPPFRLVEKAAVQEPTEGPPSGKESSDDTESFLPEAAVTTIISTRRHFSETELAQVILARSGLDREAALREYNNLLKILSRLKINTQESLRDHSVQEVDNACLGDESLSPGERILLLDLGMLDDKSILVLPTDNLQPTEDIGDELNESILLKTRVWFKQAWSWVSNVFTTMFKSKSSNN